MQGKDRAYDDLSNQDTVSDVSPHRVELSLSKKDLARFSNWLERKLSELQLRYEDCSTKASNRGFFKR